MAPLLAKRRFWFWLLSIATLAIVFFASRLQQTPKNLPIHGEIPNFQLMEASGRTVSLQDLKGKIWIADFIFTRCAGICPMMTGRMKRVQDQFKNNPEIKLVSFSVDSEYDTPERLREYASHFGVIPEQWWFLTGDKKQIHQLSQQHFHLGITDIPEAEREAPDQTVDHSSRFVLVDGEGKIRGYYDSEDPEFLNKIAKDIKSL